MRQKPWMLIFLAVLHFIAPFINMSIAATRHHVTVFKIWDLWWEQLNPIIVTGYLLLPPLAGFFIYICKRWSYYAYLVVISLVLIEGFLGFYSHMTVWSFLYLVIAAGTDVLLVAYFMVPAVKQVYLDPRLRWWEAAPRYLANFNIDLGNYGEGFAANISMGGLFLKTSSMLPDNEVIEIKWKWNDVEYSIHGHVVHHQQMDIHGYGIKFEEKDPKMVEIKKLIKDLAADHRLIVNRSGVPEIKFIDWVINLMKTGKGLFPENAASKR